MSISVLPPRLATALSAGAPLLVLSAHLDDAVLSCGAFLASAARHCPVTVATVFTAAAEPPHTRAARSFLRQCGAVDAGTLFSDRRAEDHEVLTRLGVRDRHMGATDALFRAREPRGRALQALGRPLPELTHRYPTYRFDIAKGRMARGDRALIAALQEQVAELARSLDDPLLLCPIGVGNHVDHLITRMLGRGDARVVYYSDFPYNRSAAPDRAFLARHALQPWHWDEGIVAKRHLIRGYRTQADALFPGGDIPEQPEIFYEQVTPRA